MKIINWQSSQVSSELQSLLRILGEEYQLRENSNDSGLNVDFKHSTKQHISQVEIVANYATITYDRIIDAARAVGSLLAGLEVTEYGSFSRLGIMLDCSRNAVMKVDHLKKWLRRLALMGYDTVMLYTEDCYELPQEPHFGFLRGPYSLSEMQEVDDYAAKLGIEMVACIQTLGHLEQILQWSSYADITDTARTLLIDEDKTYQLIDKMFAFWNRAFKSRTIHIGMDEAHDLGRGKFMDKHGYEDGFELFNRHLAKVNQLAQKYDYSTPMIWSDMYFRMGNDSYSYYDPATRIPKAVKEKIPTNVKLVYWDYYHEDSSFYADWIDRHRELDKNPVICSGAWSWECLWYDHIKTEKTLLPCIKSCKTKNIEEFFIAAWGDDGAYCEFDSVLAGFCYGADLNYNHKIDEKSLAIRYRAITGSSYANCLLAGEIQGHTVKTSSNELMTAAVALLWDDPLYAIVERSYGSEAARVLEQLKANWLTIQHKLNAVRNDDNIEHILVIIDLLLAKVDYRQGLIKAYRSKDNEMLKFIIKNATPDLVEKLHDFHHSMRRQWMQRNKAFGFEVIQSRIYTAIGRYYEVAERLTELLDGDIEDIEELEVPMGERYTISIPSYNRCAFPVVNRW